MIELTNISKSYESTRVLEPLNLVIERGRTTVLIGPSGCGKSTLLRIMVGLETADSGRVCFERVELTAANAAEMRRQMGYVLQDGGLFPHLTSRENVTLLARYLGKSSRGQIDARVDELADLTRVPRQILDRYPAQLSGGQRQRVAIMRAFMLDPKVVFLDAPMHTLARHVSDRETNIRPKLVMPCPALLLRPFFLGRTWPRVDRQQVPQIVAAASLVIAIGQPGHVGGHRMPEGPIDHRNARRQRVGQFFEARAGNGETRSHVGQPFFLWQQRSLIDRYHAARGFPSKGLGNHVAPLCDDSHRNGRHGPGCGGRNSLQRVNSQDFGPSGISKDFRRGHSHAKARK